MSRRIILALVLLILGTIAYILWNRDTGSTLSGPLTDFAVQDTSSVTRFFIAENNGKSADIVRQPNGHWTVNGMPASQVPVNLILKTLLRVEVRGPVAKSMEANVLRVMASSAKKVEIYEKGSDTPSKIWYVGHGTPDHFGTFALLEKPGIGKSEVPFILGMSGFTGILTPRFFAAIDDWRNTDVFRYPDPVRIRSVQVQHPGAPATSFTIRNEGTTGVQLLDFQGSSVPMDSGAVGSLLEQLKELHFEAFERKLPKARRDSILTSLPSHVVTVTDVDGTARKVTFYKKPPYPGERDMDFNPLVADMDREYAILDDTAMVVVQRFQFDRITPEIEALRHGHAPAPPPTDPASATKPPETRARIIRDR